MVLLMLFALVAGAGTALSPCVLPVLPALLSAGVTGGRRRPVGIALGLAATFTVTIVGLASVIDGVGLGPGLTRTLAVVVLIGFGIVVAVPSLAARLEAPLARLSRLGPRSARRRLRLGPARRRRAGLRLRPVRGADPGRGHRRRRGVVAHGARRPRLRAGLGARPARALARRARPRRPRARHGARPGPPARAGRRPRPHRRRDGDQPRRPLPVGHRRPPARRRWSTRRTASRPPTPSPAGSTTCAAPRASRSRPPARQGVAGARLPRLGAAPDFTGNQRWFNTPGGQPLSLRSLRGKVVLVDFWTYTCINCLRTLPYLEAWDARYRSDGLVDRRRPLARVPLRARRRQRRARDPARAASAIRWRRTTSSRRGTRGATSTGPPST